MQRGVEGRGGGLTIVGVQQGQGALSSPIHPSLRVNQRKREREEGTGSESVRKRKLVSNCEVLKAANRKGLSQEFFTVMQAIRG